MKSAITGLAILALVFVGFSIAGKVAATKPPAVYGWKLFNSERVAMKAGTIRSFGVNGTRFKMHVRSTAPISFGVASPELAKAAIKDTWVNVPFDRFACSNVDTLDADMTCDSKSMESAVVIQDRRGMLAALAGDVNEVEITLSSWDCIENCP